VKTNAGQYEYPKYNSAVSGSYKLTDDFVDNFGLVPRTVRDINFTPNDSRLPDLGICRIFSNRRDAEIIITALRSAAAAAALGSIKSAKKAASSRENGARGGRPCNPEMQYELINDDGCLMASVQTTSFKKARAHFGDRYTGKYVILCGEIDDRRNVILK
jgi:hypothetical protein